MLTANLAESLEKNWDAAKVETLDANVLARVSHPAYPLEWFLIAINPHDNLCAAIVYHSHHPYYVELSHMFLGDLVHVFTSRGLEFQPDPHFKPTRALKIWKRLKKITEGTFNA